MELKDYLASVIRDRERTVRYVSRKTGLSHTTIQRILHGFTNIDIATARALAKWCGVETAYIVNLVDPEGHRNFALEGDIAMLMETFPWMREVWQAILKAHQEKKLTIEDLKAAMEFALLKISGTPQA